MGSLPVIEIVLRLRLALKLPPYGFAGIDVTFLDASPKSLPEGGNGNPGRQTHMDW